MVCFTEVTHFDTIIAFVLPDQEFLFQRIQMFRHKDELLSGRILTLMILHGQAFFYPSVSTFIIASGIGGSDTRRSGLALTVVSACAVLAQIVLVQ